MFIKFFFAIGGFSSAYGRKDYHAVDELNIDMYMGKWYEVYEDNFDKLFKVWGDVQLRSIT